MLAISVLLLAYVYAGYPALIGATNRLFGTGAGFYLTVAVEVAVGSEHNLTRRVLLPGKARQRKKVHG